MDQEVIKTKLDILADMYAALDIVNLDKQKIIDTVNAERQAEIDKVFLPEVREALAKIEAETKAKLNDIEAEFSGRTESVNANIEEMKADIKNDAVKFGKTVKGDFMQAVFVSGRTSWDSKGLAVYAVAHPEVERFKTVGDPSVSIKFNTGK